MRQNLLLLAYTATVVAAAKHKPPSSLLRATKDQKSLHSQSRTNHHRSEHRLFAKSEKSKSAKNNEPSTNESTYTNISEKWEKIHNIENELRDAKQSLRQDFVDANKLLIVGGDILTMNPSMDVLSNNAIYIENGIIHDIGDVDALRSSYDPDLTLELEEHDIVIPGLINTHGHVCMTAFGDLVDDQELNTWLEDYIFPLEATLVTAEFCTPFFRLGMAEMLRSGTTTFLDFYFYQGEMANLVKDVGMRAVLCQAVIDFPSPDSQSPNETFAFAESFLQNWEGDEFVIPCIGPHAPYTTSPWVYQRSAELVEKYHAIMTTHLSESPSENQTIQEIYGMSPTEYLGANNFLTPKTILAHSIWLSDGDRTLIHDGGSHLAHNPTSNLKLASGVFDWVAAHDAGINIAIGTDGAGSNNDLDMIDEMRLASLLQKGTTFLPTAVSAKEALFASTMGGAIAIGKEDELGSIEVGKRADMVIVKRENNMKLHPAYDPYSAIVYSSNGNDVFSTIVGGKLLYYDGDFTTIDQDKLMEEVNLLSKQVEEEVAKFQESRG